MKELRSSCHVAPVNEEIWISKVKRKIYLCQYCGKPCRAYKHNPVELKLWDSCLEDRLIKY